MNRQAALRFYESHEFGESLLPSAVSIDRVVALGTLASGGKALHLEVRLISQTQSHAFDLLLALPRLAPGQKAPCLIGLNFCGNHMLLPHEGIPAGDQPSMFDSRGPHGPRSQGPRNGYSHTWCLEESAADGFAIATACYFDLQQDFPTGTGVLQKLSPTASAHPPGAVAAWAYGLSRIADAVSQIPEINNARLGVVGHSRLGKAALWAGATDPRFTVVIPSQSGTGGVAPNTKTSADSESVRQITTVFPHWFTPRFGQLAQSTPPDQPFPFEQTDLLRLIAPRGLLVCNADQDLWADPAGQYRLLQLASDAWPDHGGLPTTPGQPPLSTVGSTVSHFFRIGQHAMTGSEWQAYRTFAKRIWAMQ